MINKVKQQRTLKKTITLTSEIVKRSVLEKFAMSDAENTNFTTNQDLLGH